MTRHSTNKYSANYLPGEERIALYVNNNILLYIFNDDKLVTIKKSQYKLLNLRLDKLEVLLNFVCIFF